MSWLICSSPRVDMEISKTDVQKIIKYFDDAAKVYDTMPGQRNVCRAWIIRQLIKKLTKKYTIKFQNNEKNRNR